MAVTFLLDSVNNYLQNFADLVLVHMKIIISRHNRILVICEPQKGIKNKSFSEHLRRRFLREPTVSKCILFYGVFNQRLWIVILIKLKIYFVISKYLDCRENT